MSIQSAYIDCTFVSTLRGDRISNVGHYNRLRTHKKQCKRNVSLLRIVSDFHGMSETGQCLLDLDSFGKKSALVMGGMVSMIVIISI